ncbi:mucin-17-like [Dermacentor silvarum]|uniref:mucin-17-like n=1 Tax=Dermacentor silvarum TaxID=543639 RepID=UPI00210160AC|nr:mucin-17-like [Dermacentor silvarum]
MGEPSSIIENLVLACDVPPASHELTVVTEPDGPADSLLTQEVQLAMPKPEETSKPKKTQRVSRVMTILTTPSPTEKLGERSAPPISKVNSNFPKGRIVTPVAAAPDSGGGSVSEALPKSFPHVVPVKLWHNPAPMIRVNKPSTLQHPLGQLEANLGRPSTLLVNNESGMHSTAGSNDNTILVVKKMQNGRTVITAQPAKSGSKEPSCGSMSQQCSPCHVGGALSKVTASTIKLTTPVNNFVKVTANAPKMVVTESHLFAAAIPTVKSQGCSRESSSQTTGKVAKCSTSVQSWHSPAVRITPIQGSTTGKTVVVIPPQGTTMPISPAMSSSDVSPTASSKPVDEGRPAGKQKRVAAGVQDVNETTQTIEFASGQQQDEDGCGIKISDVISLAGKEGLTFPELAVPQETGENESLDASSTKSGGETYKKPDTNGDEETNSKLEMPPLPSCMLSVGANGSDGDVIELCSFQAKTGNSVIGSKIVFKPAPQGNASRSTCPSSKVDMLNKLKEAIKALEEPTLQDCNLFTEKEKGWLASLLHRFEKDARVSEASKRDPEQCSSGPNVVVDKIKTEPGVSTDTLPIKPYQRDPEQGSSGLNVADVGKLQGKSLDTNVKIKREPGISPDTLPRKAYQGVPQQVSSNFNTADAEKVHLKSSHDQSRGVNTKTKPESLHHSVPSAKNEDATVQKESIAHKPLRRIVITSDELPSLSSDEVKNGLEAFLVKNNISNNFSKDEIINLHWDGKDVSTFHFRNVDSEELQQPPIGIVKTNRPSILRPVKVPQPAGGISTEPFTTATETSSKETVSEPVLSQAEKVVEELIVPIDGSAVPAGFKAVKLNCRTDTGKVADLAPPIASKPESSAEADDAERIFEPECLLEVYNNTLELAPLQRGGMNDDSLSDTSSTSSSDASGDYVPPVVNKKKEQPPAPKRSPPKKSTLLREYRTRRRKRQCRKQDPQVVAPSAKRNASNKNDNVNVAMMSSKNCIDRPCVVSMYHLNDQVLANGFVNLTTVKHEDLFLLASSPVVRLSPDKLVSVVELKPRASDTLQQSAEVSSITDTDNLERLLKEQQNELVQLRKKYKKLSP